MKKQNRFVYIFWPIATILFLIASISVIMLASGYRLNLKNLKLEKTGTISIESLPAKANLFINDKLISTKTPYSISYLLPDRYEIKLEANGRKTWTKVVNVEAERVNFQREIILVKESINPQTYANNSTNLFDNNTSIIIKNNELVDNGIYITRFSNQITAACKVKSSYAVATNESVVLINGDGTGYTELFKINSLISKIKFIDSSHSIIFTDENNKVLTAEIY